MKKILSWLVPVFCLLVACGVLFQYFYSRNTVSPTKITGPQLKPYGEYANPVVGYVFAPNDKDSVGMNITYANTGPGDIANVKRYNVTILKRNNNFMVTHVDTIKFNNHRPAQTDVTMNDVFYLPEFLPADTQIIYLKFNCINKAGASIEPFREMFTYEPRLLNRHLPETGSSDYASVKKLLVSKRLW